MARTKNHRQKVGGMWNVIGPHQFNFMVDHGLEPHHFLLDVGCGSLRGGIHYIEYLHDAHYYGIDADYELLIAGREIEIPRAGLLDVTFRLHHTDSFDVAGFGQDFDYAIAQSVFTHLPAHKLEQCFTQLRPHVRGTFYATYWPTVTGRRFSYDPPQLAELAAGWSVDVIGEWGHPRGQHIAAFS